MTDAYELIERIEKRIAELPNGYISKKNIQGKIRYYLQWREEGKIKSKYIREEELDQLEEQIEERKRLETHLREMQGKYPTRVEKAFKFDYMMLMEKCDINDKNNCNMYCIGI